jgi:hypothetical protein
VDNAQILSPERQDPAQPLNTISLNTDNNVNDYIELDLSTPIMNLFESSLAAAATGPTPTLLGAVALVVNANGRPHLSTRSL